MAGIEVALQDASGVPAWERLYIGTAPPPPPPPPPTTNPIFGFNTSDATRDIKIGYWKYVRCGRGYYGYAALPSTGAGFRTGKEFRLAGLDNASAVSSKRINISTRFHPGDITTATSAKVIETVNYVKSIPPGWVVYLCHHEYNKNTLTAADYVKMKSGFQFLSHAVYNQSQAQLASGAGGRAIYVVNAGDSGLGSTPDLSIVPLAADMAPDYQFWTDTYFNPNGQPSGQYKAYGTTYPPFTDVMINAYDIAEAVGCHNNSDGGTRGHGYGEINAPRRVAPKLNPLDATLGWGPLSPADLSGAGQAQCISDACSFAMGTLDPTRPVPAKVFLLWMADTGNWNQRFDTGGDASAGRDDGTAANPGPHYQGFPIATNPAQPRDIYKSYVTISS